MFATALTNAALHAPAFLFGPIAWPNVNAFALLPIAAVALGWLALVAGVQLHRRAATAVAQRPGPLERRARPAIHAPRLAPVG